MRGSLLALCFAAISLAWLIFFGAGIRQSDWNAALLFIGATALFYWTFRTGQTPPRLPVWHAVALWALPGYAVLQLVPLPQALLEILSPARAVLQETLSGIVPHLGWAPISLAPAAALSGLFRLLGCLTVFSLLRDIKWRSVEGHPWIPVIPLAVIAVIEALIGIAQRLSAPESNAPRGTLATSEHFAGLMEIALPFTLMFGFISFRRYQTQTAPSAVPAAFSAASWFMSLLLLIALFNTPSRTSHIVVFCSSFVLLGFALVPRLKTARLRLYGAGGAASVALLTVLIAAPPNDFADSLAQLGATDKMPAEARLTLWNSSSSLLGEYRWFGTGMGGFEPAFLKYQGSTDLSNVRNPHNDVLALLITFGIVGSCIVLVAFVGVARPAILGALFLTDEPRRLLAACITASIVAVLLRSTMEAALSVPVIALAFAWLAGLSQSSGVD